MPSLNRTVVSFYLGGGRKHLEGLRKISREMRIGKECGKTETIGLTQVGLQAGAKLLQLVVIIPNGTIRSERDIVQ